MTGDVGPARQGPALWPMMLEPRQHGRDELCAVSADGVRVTFADGVERLCGTSGLWNVNLGYGNAAIADALGEAARHASYLSAFRYESHHARQAAQALVEVAGEGHFGRVLFSTSGGAANDLVMKLARHYHALAGENRRKVVVGLRGGYHGLTFGSFALTGEDLGQPLYGVDSRLVRHVTPNAPEELQTLLDRLGHQIAAVVVEPMLGSGAITLDDTYVDALLRGRSDHGYLLVADEVATGFGRTGRFLASERWSGRPDLMVLSKGLTNGTCAAAAVVVSRAVADAFHESGAVLTHGETQAGTSITCAAITATLAEMDRLDGVGRAQVLSGALDVALDELVAGCDRATGHTGAGCFRAVRLTGADGEPLGQAEVPHVVAAVRQQGAIVHPGPHGIQLVPALTYDASDLSELMQRTRAGLEAWAAGAPDVAVPG